MHNGNIFLKTIKWNNRTKNYYFMNNEEIIKKKLFTTVYTLFTIEIDILLNSKWHNTNLQMVNFSH